MRLRASAVGCRVLDDNGHERLPAFTVFPSRSSLLVHVSGDRYLDLLLPVLSSTMRVHMLSVPHSPWTFGEKVLNQTELLLDSRPGAVTRVSIGTVLPGANLECVRARQS
jgi:hypothetical protein